MSESGINMNVAMVTYFGVSKKTIMKDAGVHWTLPWRDSFIYSTTLRSI